MKNIYRAPAAVFCMLELEDVLTASGFTLSEEGDGDHIGIKDLQV